MTPDEITALADTHYGDDDAYDTDTQRLFALLVAVADTYVLAIRRDMAQEYERAAGTGQEQPISMGTLSGMGAIEIAVTGLAENLEMRDKDREERK